VKACSSSWNRSNDRGRRFGSAGIRAPEFLGDLILFILACWGSGLYVSIMNVSVSSRGCAYLPTILSSQFKVMVLTGYSRAKDQIRGRNIRDIPSQSPQTTLPKSTDYPPKVHVGSGYPQGELCGLRGGSFPGAVDSGLSPDVGFVAVSLNSSKTISKRNAPPLQAKVKGDAPPGAQLTGTP
jgi:hypothetical protein